MQNVMKYQIVAVFVFGNVFHQLWSVTPNRLDSLENVDFTMLNDLLDASVGSAVDSASRLAISGDDDNWAVVRFLPPSLNHIHELYQGVCGSRHFMALRPTHQLEKLACLGRCFDAGHQLGERHNLFVDPEDPCANVGVMLVRHMLHGEYLSVLFGSGTVRPEARIDITDGRGRIAKDDNGRTVMVVD
jgi:hypothetical protein